MSLLTDYTFIVLPYRKWINVNCYELTVSPLFSFCNVQYPRRHFLEFEFLVDLKSGLGTLTLHKTQEAPRWWKSKLMQNKSGTRCKRRSRQHQRRLKYAGSKILREEVNGSEGYFCNFILSWNGILEQNWIAWIVWGNLVLLGCKQNSHFHRCLWYNGILHKFISWYVTCVLHACIRIGQRGIRV